MKKSSVIANILKTFLVIVLMFPLMAAGFYLSLNAAVYHSLQKSLNLKVQGEFHPSLWKPAFEIRKAAFEWKKEAEVLSGTFDVRYDLPKYISEHQIGVQILSRNAEIKLKGDWAKFETSGTVKIQYLTLGLLLNEQGIREIHEIVAESPSFHFRFSDKEARRAA